MATTPLFGALEDGGNSDGRLDVNLQLGLAVGVPSSSSLREAPSERSTASNYCSETNNRSLLVLPDSSSSFRFQTTAATASTLDSENALPATRMARLRLSSQSPSPSSSSPSLAHGTSIPVEYGCKDLSFTSNFPSDFPSSSTFSPSQLRSEPAVIKGRRRRYLVLHPEYFDFSLELADPLLYDRLIRRFQSVAEREAEGRKKGFSGVLEADIRRSEAKLDAIAHPNPKAVFNYVRGPNGEILAEEDDEIPPTKELALEHWKYEMEMRFIRGEDDDFDYTTVDENEQYDDRTELDRRRQDKYFDQEEPSWHLEEGQKPTGETGIQDF